MNLWPPLIISLRWGSMCSSALDEQYPSIYPFLGLVSALFLLSTSIRLAWDHPLPPLHQSRKSSDTPTPLCIITLYKGLFPWEGYAWSSEIERSNSGSSKGVYLGTILGAANQEAKLALIFASSSWKADKSDGWALASLFCTRSSKMSMRVSTVVICSSTMEMVNVVHQASKSLTVCQIEDLSYCISRDNWASIRDNIYTMAWKTTADILIMLGVEGCDVIASGAGAAKVGSRSMSIALGY